MDTQRFILVLALALVSIMLWEAWQQDYGSAPARSNGQATAPGDEDLGIPQVKPDDPPAPDLPRAEGPVETGDPVVTVETDVLRLKIDRGGTIVFAELPDYPVSLDRKDQPFVLLDESASLYHVIQSGLVGDSAADPPGRVLGGTAALHPRRRRADPGSAAPVDVPGRRIGHQGVRLRARRLPGPAQVPHRKRLCRGLGRPPIHPDKTG